MEKDKSLRVLMKNVPSTYLLSGVGLGLELR